MTLLDQLRSVELFAHLSDEDLALISSTAIINTLEAGEVMFREGDEGDHAFVITEGELEILKTSGTREILLAVRRPGEMIGEMALLQAAPRSATVRVRRDARLICIPKAALDGLLATSPSAARGLFNVILKRWQSTEGRLRQNERMAQLGTLTAGLAHELNNPAAAVERSAGELAGALAEYQAAVWDLVRSPVDSSVHTAIEPLLNRVQAGVGPGPSGALEASDLETSIEDFLEDAGIDDSWRHAPGLAELGVGVDELGRLRSIAGEAFPKIVALASAALVLTSLLGEVQMGTSRLSAIVKALKSYSYLDRAPVQNVDVVAGLEDTLLILKSKLTGIEVSRQFEADMGTIEAYGSELNQVWTNLIDNAADAIVEGGRTDGRITLRGYRIDDGVTVEVEDNGPGIPPEIADRVFDSFFTTKPPGSGTGLGLDISRGIVLDLHGGDIDVISEPGKTVFRVRLPASPPR